MSQFRSYEEEALRHASRAEQLLDDDGKYPSSLTRERALIHAQLAVAFSQIGGEK